MLRLAPGPQIDILQLSADSTLPVLRKGRISDSVSEAGMARAERVYYRVVATWSGESLLRVRAGGRIYLSESEST